MMNEDDDDKSTPLCLPTNVLIRKPESLSDFLRHKILGHITTSKIIKIYNFDSW